MAEEVKFKGTRVEILNRIMRNPQRILKQAGEHLVRETMKGFSRQRRGPHRWPSRWTPNVPGILRDLASGGSVKARRFQDRPALIDTGRLRGSIAWRFRSQRVIEFGTNVSYANRMQRGGRSTVAITSVVRKNLSAFLKRRRDLRSELGWIFSEGSTLEFNVRARPFVLVTREDVRFIRGLVRRELRSGRP